MNGLKKGIVLDEGPWGYLIESYLKHDGIEASSVDSVEGVLEQLSEDTIVVLAHGVDEGLPLRIKERGFSPLTVYYRINGFYPGEKAPKDFDLSLDLEEMGATIGDNDAYRDGIRPVLAKRGIII